MNHLDKFSRNDDATTGLIKYILNEHERANLLEAIPSLFKECYISTKDLKKLCKVHNKTNKEVLYNYKLPNDGKIMSGDFGEIFCLLIVKNKLKMKGVHVFGIPKWRWKQEKNKPAPHSDAILFHLKDSKMPCEDDFIVSIESKMKATSNKAYRPIQNAIDGAEKDKLGRIAKTLVWLDEKFALEARPNLVKQLERFKNPDIYGTYKKHYKAIAIIDADLFEDEINAGWLNRDNDIKVIAFSLKDLKDIYTNTFANILELE